ncbi:DUF6129 family protein [Imhoffiella purpurea]|uniref:DUF6129 domain-containing protein n=1 Tax=Imhoffiella purpurea TaxID=1249627 RepID=W9VGI6_9GAMM|nr:DUF6129 family protein [Imhoffiella purpurea]EXJ15152.1 hypothetical protein D779_1706 [Imhoffiella purpurea]
MIEETRLQQVGEILRRAGLGDQTLSVLRETFTDLHFTSCLDEDVGVGEPALRGEGFNIYLVDGRKHCLTLTNDLEGATGLLLAQVEDEE